MVSGLQAKQAIKQASDWVWDVNWQGGRVAEVNELVKARRGGIWQI